ncbi:zinc finger protein OZF-like isoform X4 [Plodia interpunctella]|uniref:zinc finger protein OZF-like isoform X4 n=1 Tax=Plodia interpunctella TaxID=58824 RepID=UPI002368AE39|nr:zinc finger protein OZF-like isoform X4 [Plodia interpunctella]
MEDICRLCLSISQECLKNFSDDTDIIVMIQSCFSIEYKELLPNQICKSCINKIYKAFEFRKKIIENENLLLEHLKHDRDRKNIYSKIRNERNVKKESYESLENKENTTTNISADDIDINNDELKIECDNETVTNTSSDDELLSKVKQNKINAEIKIENNINLVTKTHKCLTCFEMLDTQTNLLKHYKLVHFNKKDCYKVDGYTTEVSGSIVVYKCSVCSKEYRTKKNIGRHLIGHSEDRPYQCKICGRTYKTASEIIRHGRVHNEAKLFCSHQCGYSTVYLGALRTHEKRHNKTEHKYKCETCEKGFDVRTWYEQHQNVHNGLKPFICEICGLAFHMNRYLTAHRSAVHPHTSTLKRYVCIHCSLPCDSKKALTQHLKVHGVKSSFLCDVCGKTLCSAEQLKFHKRMHLGEKPYTCSTCNKSFSKKYNLSVHEAGHARARAHACSCGRRYSQRSTLLRHYNRHHPGDRPVDCYKCQKSFPSMSKQLLKIHLKNCKNED